MYAIRSYYVPGTAETQPEVVAHHYTEAGLAEQAIRYWHRAGQRAVERSGNIEAVAQLTKGLELTRALKETPERARQELNLYLTLGPAVITSYSIHYTKLYEPGRTPAKRPGTSRAHLSIASS